MLIFNNLKAKAKCIYNKYANQMNEIDKSFYVELMNKDYIFLNDIELFNNCDYKYRAFNSGLI